MGLTTVLSLLLEAVAQERQKIGGLIPDPCGETAEVSLDKPLYTKLPQRA